MSLLPFRRARAERLRMPQSIREAIDYLPEGICLSAPDGSPILTNRRMNELAYALTGHTIMNVQKTWEELELLESGPGFVRLAEPEDGSLLFQLADGRVWAFRREELTDSQPRYLQLEAAEITDLYRYGQELLETNKRLYDQFQRRRKLLESIVEINRQKELLAMKMRIHDDLGHTVLATKQHLSSGTLAENLPQLTEIWSNTIGRISDFSRAAAPENPSPEAELQKAAGMVGCRIRYHGEPPAGHKTALLFFASVREALTNAVRHANASELNVSVTSTASQYHIEISDNGMSTASAVTEGNGLSNLRRRLEQEGAALIIRCTGGVRLLITLPREGDHTV